MKRTILASFLLLVTICGSISNELECKYQVGVSEVVSAILCAVENRQWFIPNNSFALANAGCLLGKKRCDSVLQVPTEKDISVSGPPPSAKNQRYQELATAAEQVVPQTWWRKGYADPKLLLTPTNGDFPRRLFDSKGMSNKKLRNFYECVTRQQFIRKSFDFNTNSARNISSTILSSRSAGASATCVAMTEPLVQRFFQLWQQSKLLLDGKFTSASPNKQWLPDPSSTGQLLVSAHEVLEYFYAQHGGIWTGCFALEKSADCRGALAAASLVIAVHQIADIAGRKKTITTESQFVRGYILASLGRHLLHGDTGSVGDQPLTTWGLRPYDYILLQSSYLQLYIQSFGRKYNQQLTEHIPLAFHPDFTVHAKQQWRHLAESLEPIYTSVRNWMYTESFNLIDFGPYLPLVAFKQVRELLTSVTPQPRRILIDVGANGFFASPKYLIDSYAPFLPFTHVIMIEPEPHFSATIPKAYNKRYNVSFHQIYAEVATGSETDMLRLLPTIVTKDDFVVLKFDVDPNR